MIGGQGSSLRWQAVCVGIILSPTGGRSSDNKFHLKLKNKRIVPDLTTPNEMNRIHQSSPSRPPKLSLSQNTRPGECKNTV